jgi:anti-sigma factor (TIGR02949 family)
MNCQETEPLLEGYFDGEVDLVRSLEIEKHLEGCPHCAERLKERQSVRTLLKSAAPYYSAPEDLRAWVRNQGHTLERTSSPTVWNWQTILSGWQAWVPAGAFAILFTGLYWGSPMISRYSVQHRLADEVVSAHVRSMMVSHLTDVPSSDQHTVKPWFNGKLDFAPMVRDLKEYEFPLVGGRLDYLMDRPVAALVYGRNQHRINLFIWPAPREGEHNLTALSRRGYNLLTWNRGGMTYWAVSDLNPHELQQFAQIVQTQALLP